MRAKNLLLSVIFVFLLTSCQEEEGPGSVVNLPGTPPQQGNGPETPADPPVDNPSDDEPGDSDEPVVGEEYHWQDVAQFLISETDPYFGLSELAESRSPASFSRGDDCHQDLNNQVRFGDALGFFIDELSESQKVQLQGIATYYGMESDDSNYYPVSLVSHPLCRVTRTTLNSTVRNVPGLPTIEMADRFANDHNRLRQAWLSGDQEALFDLKKLWGRFFGCLAYTESLTTADANSSYRVASRFAPSGYRKPAGVKFYDDPAQSSESRLNIGLFQFTPNYYGNINVCFRQWNRDYPQCSIARSGQGEMIKVVGSSLQHFNAFCGVHKVVQTFAVQVNSRSSRNTHPDNKRGGGLKPADERCVTPHFYAGWAYNHFGPLQNSTGNNLSKLLKCVYSN